MTDEEFLEKICKIGFYTTEFNWKDREPSDVLRKCPGEEPCIIFVNDDWELKIEDRWGWEDNSYWSKTWFQLVYKGQLIENRWIDTRNIRGYDEDNIWNSMNDTSKKVREKGKQLFELL